MTQTTAPAPAIAPDLPNASIDMNQLLANDAAGKTGDELFHDAILVPPAEAISNPEPTEPTDREPIAGDTVTHEPTGGGWYAITASWLVEPIKVQGEANALERVTELNAMIPVPVA
jgi:hypothetical protein